MRNKRQNKNEKQIKSQNKVLTNGEKTDIVKSTKENGRKKQKERTDHREHNELPHKLRKRRYGPKKTYRSTSKRNKRTKKERIQSNAQF